MNKKFRLFLCLVAIFVVSIGINVNAADDDQWYSEIEVLLPIHKTDEAGKNLEGAVFTLKDFNDTISYSSSYEGDGDYLIEAYKENPDNLDKIINSLPSNYKEVITGIKSWEDVQNLQDRDDMYVDFSSSDPSVSFYIPLKLEESVVPTGYQKQDFVVNGIVKFYFERPFEREDIEARSEYFDEFLDNGIVIHSKLIVVELPENVPGYFVYNSSTDYDSIYKNLNKKYSAIDDYYESYEKYMSAVSKIFEDEGYNTKDVKCPSYQSQIEVAREDLEFRVWNPYCGYGGDERRENFEARFDDIVENCYCVIQLKNKKENIVVNPQTASTIGIISLITLGSIGFITAKKLRKNN